MPDEPKPVLWVSCTTQGRTPQELDGPAKPDADHLEYLAAELENQFGDRYEIVVADDKVRLLDAAEIRCLIEDLQDYAAQFRHEDALFEAAQDGDESGN